MKNKKLDELLEICINEEECKKLNKGTNELLRFYYYSKELNDENNKVGALIVDDIVWEVDEFIEALLKNDVKELVFASTWSSAIKLEMSLMENGYMPTEVVVYSERMCFGKKEIKKGIKMILK